MARRKNLKATKHVDACLEASRDGGSNPPASIMVYVYVLQNLLGKKYVGITNNLKNRLTEHRSVKTLGSGDFFVLHSEEFPDHKTARVREKFLKSGRGREFLKQLYQVDGTGPAKGG